MHRPLGLALMAICLSGAMACQDYFDNPMEDATATYDSIPFTGLGVGGACAESGECREGLTCQTGQCTPVGNRPLDQRCLLSAECGPDLNCSWAGFCADAADEAISGQECSSSVDCVKGDFCHISSFTGFCRTPSPDAGDLGAACQDTAGCLAGLTCSQVSQTCVAGSLLLNPDLFMGVKCPDESELDFGVRMAVPGQDPDLDFYSFPFPADVRVLYGRINLTDHPRPGPGVVGFDMVDAVLGAIGEEMEGFGLFPAVYFRFSRPVDESTLTLEGAEPTLWFVNLDTGAKVPAVFHMKAERNKYICHDHLYVHPVWSRALEPGTPYAVVVTTGVRSLPETEGGQGEAAVPLDQLSELLAHDAPPVDGKLKDAWQTFAPLRAWLGPTTILKERVAGATVFTTADPLATMRAFQADAKNWDVPVLVPDSVFVCKPDATQKSPCATPDWESTAAGAEGKPDPRDCPLDDTLDSGYHEIHAKVRLPVFQEGVRPYLDDGGWVRIVDGKPETYGTEDVCVAISVPKGAPKPWPVVLYAHGTNGSFRGGVSRLAHHMASRGVAMVGIDQPMHGDRRQSNLGSGALFYNYANPPAAKGNLYQGAAENYALLRFIQGFDGTLGAAGKVTFDGARIVFMGHSQGATSGPMFLAFGAPVKSAILSGAGGSLVYGLLGKEKPYNISVGVRNVLQEMEVDAFHPVLNLIQMYFEEADPLVYAPLLFTDPEGDPVHVLNIFGWDDGYTPWRTSAIFAAAMGGGLGQPDHRPQGLDTAGLDPVADLGLPTVALPAQGNVGGNVTGVTLAQVSDGEYDGHFVSFHDPAMLTAAVGFLETSMSAGAPVVPGE